jgi:multiple sugar transport system permease protein
MTQVAIKTPRVLDAKAKRTRLVQKLAPYGFVTPVSALILVLMVIPIIIVIGYSTLDNVVVVPESNFVGLENYVKILSDGTFYIATRNSLIFTLSSVAAHFILGLLFATLLNTRLLSPFVKAIFRTLFILPWLFTVAIIAVLWRMLLNPNGIINYLLISSGVIDVGVEWLSSRSTALLAITVINIWAGYPFFMVSLLAGLQGIPRDLYEAATVDGASPFQQFWHVTLPQLRPIIVSMMILDMIWTSQQFALIWLTTGGGPINATEMLPTYTYKLAFSTFEFGLASASAVIILLLSMVLAFFYVRHQKVRD